MNKFAKGSLAAGAGLVLLLGGAGTLAYWNDSAELEGGTIEAGSMTFSADTTVTASSSETLPGGARVSDSFSHPENRYTLTGVLIDSSNVGISKFAEMIPAQTRFDYLQKFGMGTTSAIDFPGESGGILHPVQDWDKQTFFNTAFGQGLSVTVPQLVGAYQTIAKGLLDIVAGDPIALVVETGCRYARPLGYPAPVEIGVAIVRIGTSSVTYRLGAFAAGAAEAAAEALFTHVCVDRATHRPMPLPRTWRAAMATLQA